MDQNHRNGPQIVGTSQPVNTGLMFQQMQAPTGSVLSACQRTVLKALSIVQVACGGFSIILDTCRAVDTGQALGFSGMCTPTLYIAAGILGIFGADRGTKKLMTATMVMSILSSAAAIVIAALMGDFLNVMYVYTGTWKRYSIFSNAMTISLLVSCAAEFVTSIWVSVLCFIGVCVIGNIQHVYYAWNPATEHSRSSDAVQTPAHTVGQQVVNPVVHSSTGQEATISTSVIGTAVAEGRDPKSTGYVRLA